MALVAVGPWTPTGLQGAHQTQASTWALALTWVTEIITDPDMALSGNTGQDITWPQVAA